MFVITFLICLFSNAAALAAHRRPGAFVSAGVGVAICAAALVFSVVRLSQPQGPAMRIAALADNDTTDPKFGVTPNFGHGGLSAAGNAFAPVIRDAAAKGAKLIVTPEGGLFAHPSWQRAVLAPIGAAAADSHALVVTGLVVFTTKDDHATHAADLAIAYPPNGKPITYVKRHLLKGLEDNFVPGHAPGFIGGGVAMAICKDMDFPRTLRDDANAGDIRMMAVPASDLKLDGWMHGRLAVLRGVENGFAVVRPANEGYVLVSDAQGRILARKSTMHPGMVSAIVDLPMGPGRTLYTRIGDVFPWLCVVLTILAGGVAMFRSRRRAT
jgi:apolipoprotein N-acyltransferase